MKDNPLVSIIIVNYNGRSYLEECFASLMKVTYPNYEIIIVDNNSSDDSIEFVKNNFPKIMIIKLEKNYGFAEPNNIGAKNARGDFLLFLNNDTIVEPNFVSELVKVITQNSKIAICQSLLLKPNGDIDSSGDFVDIYGRAFNSRNKVTSVQRILSARGASMLINKKIFQELGGFDENFFASFEDVDLGWRACICGYDVMLVPNSIVYHEGSQTIKKISSELVFHSTKNSLMLRLVNFETSYALKSLLTMLFVVMARKLFKVKVIKDPEQPPPLPSFKNLIHGSCWVIKNFKHITKKRKLLNSKRKRSTKELVKMGLITKI